jgi:hypothetical protein
MLFHSMKSEQTDARHSCRKLLLPTSLSHGHASQTFSRCSQGHANLNSRRLVATKLEDTIASGTSTNGSATHPFWSATHPPLLFLDSDSGRYILGCSRGSPRRSFDLPTPVSTLCCQSHYGNVEFANGVGRKCQLRPTANDEKENDKDRNGTPQICCCYCYCYCYCSTVGGSYR